MKAWGGWVAAAIAVGMAGWIYVGDADLNAEPTGRCWTAAYQAWLERRIPAKPSITAIIETPRAPAVGREACSVHENGGIAGVDGGAFSLTYEVRCQTDDARCIRLVSVNETR